MKAVEKKQGSKAKISNIILKYPKDRVWLVFIQNNVFGQGEEKQSLNLIQLQVELYKLR